MDLKRLITHFVYRIEPKPEGGFIARPSDPSVPSLEAPTRGELQQKIQQNILQSLSAEFPGLKLPLDGKTTEFAFHIEHKPEGGFAIHSSDANAGVIEAGTKEEVEGRFLEKFLGSAAQRLMPEIGKALAASALSGNVKVMVNRKTSFTLNSDSKETSVGSLQPTSALASFSSPADGNVNRSLGTLGGSIDRSPIVPESSGNWKVFALLIAVVIAGAFYYFLGR